MLLDGRALGKTPLDLRAIPAGHHRLILLGGSYGVAARDLRLEPGSHQVVRVRLVPAPALSAEERERRERALVAVMNGGHSRGSQAVRSLLRARARVRSPRWLPAGASSLFQETSETVDSDGRLVDTTTYYLDEDETTVAGTMTVVNDLTTTTTDYSFTAGTLSGSSGHYTDVRDGSGSDTFDGQDILPDGSSTTLHYVFTADPVNGATTSGTMHVVNTGTDPGSDWTFASGTTGWNYHVVATDNHTYDFNYAIDGSGGGGQTDSTTGNVLAVFTWDTNESGTTSFPDGSPSISWSVDTLGGGGGVD